MNAFFVPLAIGLAFALGAIALLRLTSMERDRASAPIVLIAIALFYPVFAAENGDGTDIAIHAAIAALFTALAVVGYRRGLALIGVGMIAHGLFDLAMGAVAGNPAPAWWAPFCLGVDVVLGGWLLMFRPWQRAREERASEGRASEKRFGAR